MSTYIEAVPPLSGQGASKTNISPTSTGQFQENCTILEEARIVLIIEDNADMRAYIREAIEKEYKIIEAANGREGIEKAGLYILDLIISDVMMPEKNGYEVCRELKQDEKTSHIPIILLTARAARENKLHGLQTGADDYLIKPFDVSELQGRIQNLIKLRHSLQQYYRSQLMLEIGTGQIHSQQQTKQLQKEPLPEDPFLEKIISIIAANYQDEKFGVATLAYKVNMDRTHLYRKLKALTDKNVSNLIREYRLTKAMDLLKTGKHRISEVAYDTGFGSPARFATVFKEHFGISPNEVIRKGD